MITQHFLIYPIFIPGKPLGEYRIALQVAEVLEAEAEAEVAVKEEDGTGTEGSTELLGDTEHALFLSPYVSPVFEVSRS